MSPAETADCEERKESGMKPRCMVVGCSKIADYQIGCYIRFKSDPRFYCHEHLPNWAREKIERGEFIETEDTPHETGDE